MSVVEHDVPVDELQRRLADKEREVERLRASLAAWEGMYERAPKRDASFTSVSGAAVEPLHTPLDRPATAPEEAAYYAARIGLPGEFPFTRGPYGTMYRTRLWTMRQFAGFGTAEETNARYHFLLKRGQTGLSVAFDFPTLMGYDSDHPRSLGEVGKCGVAISSLDDMETLFDGIPLDRVSVSMTINGPAIILFCFYIIAAEKQGVPFDQLRGTVQNDILKEYQAQHAWVFPPEPALRLIVDMFEWASESAPKYNPISISGYHIREAGSTAAQELAYTLRNGFEYVRAGDRARAGRGRLRAAPLLLLGRPQRLLRGDRQVPRRAPHLGAPPARRVRREEPGVVAPAHARADGGGDAHRAAAGEQHRARRLPGDGGGAGRHAVAAHQLDGRDARAPHREGGADRAAHAAGARLRDRRPQHHRPARGLVLRGGADRPARGGGGGDLRGDRQLGGVVPGIEVGYFQREIARSAMRQQREIENASG
jgi:hypothetical protein